MLNKANVEMLTGSTISIKIPRLTVRFSYLSGAIRAVLIESNNVLDVANAQKVVGREDSETLRCSSILDVYDYFFSLVDGKVGTIREQPYCLNANDR